MFLSGAAVDWRKFLAHKRCLLRAACLRAKRHHPVVVFVSCRLDLRKISLEEPLLFLEGSSLKLFRVGVLDVEGSSLKLYRVGVLYNSEAKIRRQSQLFSCG